MTVHGPQPTLINRPTISDERSHRLAEIAALLDELTPIDDAAGPIPIPLVLSEAAWDQVTIAREDIFFRRFGFDWPHHHRAELLSLKHAHELSDREIRLLHQTGDIRRYRTGVRYVPSRLTAAFGWVIIATLAPMALVLTARAVMSPALAPSLLLLASVFLLCVFAVQWFAYRFYVTPWRIFRRFAK
jgi:hypothetical protein